MKVGDCHMWGLDIFFKRHRFMHCFHPNQINMLVIELKSEALKDRHWKQLMKRLHVNWVVSELTLGQIWDVDLQKNEAVVKDVLLVAQGEMALEEFLKQAGDGHGYRAVVWI